MFDTAGNYIQNEFIKPCDCGSTIGCEKCNLALRKYKPSKSIWEMERTFYPIYHKIGGRWTSFSYYKD